MASFSSLFGADFRSTLGSTLRQLRRVTMTRCFSRCHCFCPRTASLCLSYENESDSVRLSFLQKSRGLSIFALHVTCINYSRDYVFSKTAARRMNKCINVNAKRRSNKIAGGLVRIRNLDSGHVLLSFSFIFLFSSAILLILDPDTALRRISRPRTTIGEKSRQRCLVTVRSRSATRPRGKHYCAKRSMNYLFGTGKKGERRTIVCDSGDRRHRLQ